MVEKKARPKIRTSAKIRREIQMSDENDTKLAKRLGVNRKTVAKWKRRDSTFDAPMGSKDPRSNIIMTEQDEAIIIAFRRRTHLSLNDCLVRLQRQMPHLTRSTLHRCFRRHRLSKIGRTSVSRPLGDDSLLNGLHCFEIAIEEILFEYSLVGVIYSVFLAVDEVTKCVFAEIVKSDTPQGAAAFLTRLCAEFPQKIFAVATDLDPIFTENNWTLLADMAAESDHPFAVICRANGVAHSQASPSESGRLEPRRSRR